MKIKFLELTNTSARFVLSDATPAEANALRRTLLSEIPKLAIDKVEILLGNIRDESGKEYESVTPLFDEIIVHRLAMVPLPTDLSMKFPSECGCKGEGCQSCSVIYTINKKGPGMVYSGDLIPLGDPKFKPVDDLIPIVKINEKQAVLLYATAIMGRAKEHAKWQVAHAVGYKYYPDVKINGEKCTGCTECINSCPKKVFENQDGKVVAKTVDACDLCGACVEACPKGALSVTGSEKDFIFTFETDGSLSAKAALIKALDILSTSFGRVKDTLSMLG
ncbi:MAG: DNA-directed RNA polymerase subunit D [Thermoplasmata archaeon]|nr:DNA-directed RNA polymerase subunit D [Thermoplasmata archaeon]